MLYIFLGYLFNLFAFSLAKLVGFILLYVSTNDISRKYNINTQKTKIAIIFTILLHIISGYSFNSKIILTLFSLISTIAFLYVTYLIIGSLMEIEKLAGINLDTITLNKVFKIMGLLSIASSLMILFPNVLITKILSGIIKICLFAISVIFVIKLYRIKTAFDVK